MGFLRKLEREVRRVRVQGTEHAERAAKQIEEEVRRIRDQTATNLDHLAKKVEHTTGIDPKPLLKAVAGPAHILVKVAEGHNLTEATTDWVVQQTEGAGQLGGVLGSDVETVARSIVSYSNVPLLLLVNLAGDTMEVVEADQRPEDLLGVPLATLIRTAHAMYARHANPLPIEVRAVLASVVPREVLRRARFVIDRSPDNVAGLANRLHGNRHAVTIDDIVVFSSPPSGDLAGYLHWVHELAHVQQYASWGVLEFARRYSTDHDDVEDDAHAAEAAARPVLRDQFELTD